MCYVLCVALACFLRVSFQSKSISFLRSVCKFTRCLVNSILPYWAGLVGGLWWCLALLGDSGKCDVVYVVGSKGSPATSHF